MIRKFQQTDTGQVMQIWLKGNIDAHPFIPKEYWESNFEMVQEQLIQAEVYVHETNDTIQGFIGIQDDYIAGIFVKKECRSQGIGKRLLDHVQSFHKELTLNVYKKNYRAMAFYQREGFLAVSEQLDEDTGEMEVTMQIVGDYSYVTLRDKPEMKAYAAEWFHDKWGVPQAAYLECMERYLKNEAEYGWYLCLDGEKIIGGLGVIENDFHDRKDLSPNVCAVYTEKEYRCKGIAGRLLNMVVNDLKAKDISPIYLVTDHIGFYERYGWEFLCMVQGDGEPEMTRMYIHQ